MTAEKLREYYDRNIVPNAITITKRTLPNYWFDRNESSNIQTSTSKNLNWVK